MSFQIKSITAPKILELIEQYLSKTDQQWLNTRLAILLQKPSLSIIQKQDTIDKLCGSWSDDSSLPPIFSKIEQQRALTKPREVSF